MLFVFWNNAMQIRMYYHPQVEMFVSVYANVHYHRYLGPQVAGCTILATSTAMLLLATTVTPKLPNSNHVSDLGFCTYFNPDKFYFRPDNNNQHIRPVGNVCM